jgi:hypothetical protein
MRQEIRVRIHMEKINREQRGFRIVVANVNPEFGVHLETAGNTMRSEFIGFRPDGSFEISSRLHCAVREFVLQASGDLVGPTIIEGTDDCEEVTPTPYDRIRSISDSRVSPTTYAGPVSHPDLNIDAATAIQVLVAESTSPAGSNPEVAQTGLFDVIGNVGKPIRAVACVRISEGSFGNEFSGDAIFEIRGVTWNPNGDFRLSIGEFHRRYFPAEIRPFSRDLPFVITITYVPG